MNEKILIIEDEPYSISRIPKNLEQINMYVDIAEDLDVAIAKLQKEKYDLVILDIMFAEGEHEQLDNLIQENLENSEKYKKYYRRGIALFKLIKRGVLGEKNRDVPVVVISATPDQNDIQEIKSILEDSDAYFEKPVESKMIIEKIKEVLRDESKDREKASLL